MTSTTIPARRSGTSLRPILAELAFAGTLFGGLAIVGLALLVGFFKAGLLSSIDILFYRGLAICGLVSVLVTASALSLARFGVTVRDAIAAGVLSLGVNMTVLVVAPVTVDRSLSVFMIGYMATDPDRTFTAEDLEAAFVARYLGDMRQVPRRLDEQMRTGNIEIAADGRYRLTAQGRAFLDTARWTAWAFNTDRRLVDQAR